MINFSYQFQLQDSSSERRRERRNYARILSLGFCRNQNSRKEGKVPGTHVTILKIKIVLKYKSKVK
jgi:hypothetical protein